MRLDLGPARDRSTTSVASSRGRFGAIAAAATLCFALGGCILISGSDDAVQCETDQECTDRGGDFAGSICSEGVCVARASEAVSSGATTTASTGSGETGCTTNAACSAELGEPAICRNAGEECVSLYSEDCFQVLGPHEDDNAVFFGLTHGFTGAYEFAGKATIPYFQVALDEINETHGGLPGVAGGPKRPLVGILCDAADDAERAATHLVENVGVQALTTEYTAFVLELSNVTVPNGVFLLSATASLDQLDSLSNSDLVWSMAPRQRDIYPAYRILAEQLEAQIREARGLSETDELKMALLVSSALKSTGDQLTPTLEINGMPAVEADEDVFKRIDYDNANADYATVAASLVDFAPDIIVAISSSEMIDEGLLTLVEENWDAATPRPEWIFEKSVLATPNVGIVFTELGDDVRNRSRGIELLYFYDTPEHRAFEIRFEAATGSPPVPTVDEYYESNYMIAYLMMATRAEEPTGVAMAQAVAKLDGTSPQVYAGPNDYTEAGQALLAGQAIELSGAMGDYEFDFIDKHLVRKYAIVCVARDEDGELYLDVTGEYGIYDPVTEDLSNLGRCE